MSSQKQLDANRRNAQKSAGPRTPEGRAAVSHNAVTHGLTAESLLVDTEDEDAFNQLSQAFQDEYQPQTPTEHTLLEQLVCAAWRLRRVRVVEQGIFDDQLSQTLDDLDAIHGDLPDPIRLGRVFRRDSSGPQALVNLSRYEARIERSYYKALHELRRLHDRRDKEDLTKQTQLAPAPAPIPDILDDRPFPSRDRKKAVSLVTVQCRKHGSDPREEPIDECLRDRSDTGSPGA